MTSITSLCSLCSKEVHNNDKALNCDLCDTWEHQDCISQVDHQSEVVCHSIALCSGKSIVFVWTASKHKGSFDKKLFKYELESMHANEKCWPANGCLRSSNR